MFKIEHKTCGWKVTTDNDTYYIGEFGGDGVCEGVIYKDDEAFESGIGVCYVNEYGFDNDEQNATELFEFAAKAAATEDIATNPYVTNEGYTRKDLEDICEEYGWGKEYAYDLYEGCNWQSPESYINEWTDEDIHQ